MPPGRFLFGGQGANGGTSGAVAGQLPPPCHIMLEVGVRMDAPVRRLSNIETRQLPFALSQALNDSAKEALELVQRQMDTVFDRPTPWTQNALMVWRATKETLEAQVKERPSVGRRHYLKVQEFGGQRPMKGIERNLATRLPYEGIIGAVIPGDAAQMDAYGNWSRGQQNKILSALQAQADPFANTPSASGKRRKRKPRDIYFVPKPGQLSPGIWRRRDGFILDKVALFIDYQPQYQPRFEFYETAEASVRESLPRHFATRMAQAVATAR